MQKSDNNQDNFSSQSNYQSQYNLSSPDKGIPQRNVMNIQKKNFLVQGHLKKPSGVMPQSSSTLAAVSANSQFGASVSNGVVSRPRIGLQRSPSPNCTQMEKQRMMAARQGSIIGGLPTNQQYTNQPGSMAENYQNLHLSRKPSQSQQLMGMSLEEQQALHECTNEEQIDEFENIEEEVVDECEPVMHPLLHGAVNRHPKSTAELFQKGGVTGSQDNGKISASRLPFVSSYVKFHPISQKQDIGENVAFSDINKQTFFGSSFVPLNNDMGQQTQSSYQLAKSSLQKTQELLNEKMKAGPQNFKNLDNQLQFIPDQFKEDLSEASLKREQQRCYNVPSRIQAQDKQMPQQVRQQKGQYDNQRQMVVFKDQDAAELNFEDEAKVDFHEKSGEIPQDLSSFEQDNEVAEECEEFSQYRPQYKNHLLQQQKLNENNQSQIHKIQQANDWGQRDSVIETVEDIKESVVCMSQKPHEFDQLKDTPQLNRYAVHRVNNYMDSDLKQVNQAGENSQLSDIPSFLLQQDGISKRPSNLRQQHQSNATDYFAFQQNFKLDQDPNNNFDPHKFQSNKDQIKRQQSTLVQQERVQSVPSTNQLSLKKDPETITSGQKSKADLEREYEQLKQKLQQIQQVNQSSQARKFQPGDDQQQKSLEHYQVSVRKNITSQHSVGKTGSYLDEQINVNKRQTQQQMPNISETKQAKNYSLLGMPTSNRNSKNHPQRENCRTFVNNSVQAIATSTNVYQNKVKQERIIQNNLRMRGNQSVQAGQYQESQFNFYEDRSPIRSIRMDTKQGKSQANTLHMSDEDYPQHQLRQGQHVVSRQKKKGNVSFEDDQSDYRSSRIEDENQSDEEDILSHSDDDEYSIEVQKVKKSHKGQNRVVTNTSKSQRQRRKQAKEKGVVYKKTFESDRSGSQQQNSHDFESQSNPKYQNESEDSYYSTNKRLVRNQSDSDESSVDFNQKSYGPRQRKEDVGRRKKTKNSIEEYEASNYGRRKPQNRKLRKKNSKSPVYTKRQRTRSPSESEFSQEERHSKPIYEVEKKNDQRMRRIMKKRENENHELGNLKKSKHSSGMIKYEAPQERSKNEWISSRTNGDEKYQKKSEAKPKIKRVENDQSSGLPHNRSQSAVQFQESNLMPQNQNYQQPVQIATQQVLQASQNMLPPNVYILPNQNQQQQVYYLQQPTNQTPQFIQQTAQLIQPMQPAFQPHSNPIPTILLNPQQFSGPSSLQQPNNFQSGGSHLNHHLHVLSDSTQQLGTPIAHKMMVQQPYQQTTNSTNPNTINQNNRSSASDRDKGIDGAHWSGSVQPHQQQQQHSAPQIAEKNTKPSDVVGVPGNFTLGRHASVGVDGIYEKKIIMRQRYHDDHDADEDAQESMGSQWGNQYRHYEQPPSREEGAAHNIAQGTGGQFITTTLVTETGESEMIWPTAQTRNNLGRREQRTGTQEIVKQKTDFTISTGEIPSTRIEPNQNPSEIMGQNENELTESQYEPIPIIDPLKKRGGEAFVFNFNSGQQNQSADPFANKPTLKSQNKTPKPVQKQPLQIKNDKKQDIEQTVGLEKMQIIKPTEEQIKAAEERRAKIKAQGLIEISTGDDSQLQSEEQIAKRKMFEKRMKAQDQDVSAPEHISPAKNKEKPQKTAKELAEIRRQMLKKKFNPQAESTPQLQGLKQIQTQVQKVPLKKELDFRSRSQTPIKEKTHPSNQKPVISKINQLKKEPNAELMDRLATGRKAIVTKQEMKKTTQKRFQNLPEIKQKKEEERRKQEAQLRKERISAYNKELMAKSKAANLKKQTNTASSSLQSQPSMLNLGQSAATTQSQGNLIMISTPVMKLKYPTNASKVFEEMIRNKDSAAVKRQK